MFPSMPQLGFEAVQVFEASVAANHIAAALGVFNGHYGHFAEEELAFGHGSCGEHAFALPSGVVADLQNRRQIGAAAQGRIIAVGIIGAR